MDLNIVDFLFWLLIFGTEYDSIRCGCKAVKTEASATRPIIMRQRVTLTADDDSALGANYEIKFGG